MKRRVIINTIMVTMMMATLAGCGKEAAPVERTEEIQEIVDEEVDLPETNETDTEILSQKYAVGQDFAIDEQSVPFVQLGHGVEILFADEAYITEVGKEDARAIMRAEVNGVKLKISGWTAKSPVKINCHDATHKDYIECGQWTIHYDADYGLTKVEVANMEEEVCVNLYLSYMYADNTFMTEEEGMELATQFVDFIVEQFQ